MKKAIVLLLALVVVGAFAFAEDAPAPTYTLSMSAEGGWTANLTQETSTFINSYDFSFKYYLFNNTGKTTKGEEGTYGQIDVTRLNLAIVEETEDNDADGSTLWTDKNPDDGIDVSAKIVSGPIEIGLYGAPGDNYENAKFVPLFDKDKGFEGTGDRDSMLKPDIGIDKGLSLKYTFGEMGSIKLMAGNSGPTAEVAQGTDITGAWYLAAGDEEVEANVAYFVAPNGAGVLATALVADTWYWKETVTAAVAAADTIYKFGAELSLTPVKDLLALFVGGWYDTDSKLMIFSTTAKVTAGDLSAGFALDGLMPDGEDLQFDAAVNVAYSLFEKKDSVNLDFYYLNDEAVAVGSSDSAITDLGLKFVDAGGLVEPLSFTLGVFYADLLGNYTDFVDPNKISFAESVSYKVALSDATYVKPYQALRYDMNDSDPITDAKAGTFFKAGVEAQLFANTILTAEYQYGDDNPDFNELLTKGAAMKDSQITIKAKVTL